MRTSHFTLRTRHIAVTSTMIVLFIASLALAYGISRPGWSVTVSGLTFSLPSGWQSQPAAQGQAGQYVDPAHPGRKLAVLTLNAPAGVSGEQVLGRVADQLIPPQVQQVIQPSAPVVMPGPNLTGWLFTGRAIITPAAPATTPPNAPPSASSRVNTYTILLLTANQRRYWVFYLTDTAASPQQFKQRAQLNQALIRTLRESTELANHAS